MKKTLPEWAQQQLRDGVVIPAMPLALQADGTLDERRQRALIRYYIDAGVGGIAAAVHTTQFEIRENPPLFRRLLELVSHEIDRYGTRQGRKVIRIAGVSGRREQALEEARFASEAGYDIAMISPGAFAGDPDASALEGLYREVAEILPVFGFYLQESVGGRKLPYEFWRAVASIPNLVGIKMAPFDRYRTLEVVRAVADSGRAEEISLYTGNDDNIVIDLLSEYRISSGGGTVSLRIRGGLLGHWCVWTAGAVRMLERIKQVRSGSTIPADLLALANEVTDANGAFFDVANNFRGCIAGLHEVLRRQGFFEEIRCLAENGILSAGQAEEIDRVYRSYPHLADDDFVKEHLADWMGE